jgi:carboxyl-terminal processing protease
MSRRLLLVLSTAAVLVAPASAHGQSSARAQAIDNRPSASAAREGVEQQVFMEALQLILSNHLSSFSDSTLWTRALDGLIENLDDPYASVFTPAEVEEFEESTTGTYAGIGVSIVELNDVVTITAVFRGAPAARAGLQVGDVIVGVNGSDASSWTTEVTSDSIRGPVGTEVDVLVRRDGVRQPLSFKMERDSVHMTSVQWAVLPGNIGYIANDRVARQSARELIQALDSLKGTRGIVVDLRRNPGGYLDESLLMADAFLGRGAILATTRNRTSTGPLGEVSEESYRGRMQPRIPNTPIVILVDRYTASAAEIVTGALQDHDRALVLGERSFGKGVVQSVVDLPFGRKLRITTGSWHTPLGRSLHRERTTEGEPLPENLDTIAPIATRSGRSLRNGGGIFPDLEVASDSLSAVERELLAVAQEEEIPLSAREQETAFARARALRAAGQPPSLDDATFESYVSGLASAGLADQVAREEIRRYLRWRLSVAVTDRMEDIGAGTMARLERDPVLRSALELLSGSTTQNELFVAAERAKAQSGASASLGVIR